MRVAQPQRRRLGAAPGRAQAGGFTLIEVLVVLAVTAAISLILGFAFDRVLDIRVRLAAFLEGTDVPILVAEWFRGSVHGLVPDAKGGADVFVGAPGGFSGLSVAPLEGPPGVPVRITWSVGFDAAAGRTYLRYQTGSGVLLTVASWPENLGQLRYCGPDLSCYESWPPNVATPAQLPALIRLVAVRGDAAWTILAAPRAAQDPLPPALRRNEPP